MWNPRTANRRLRYDNVHMDASRGRRKWIIGVVLATVLSMAIGTASASSHHRRRSAQTQQQTSFDYFLLTLTWAPDFCALGNGAKDPSECGRGRNVGFVVHGLWPQGEHSRGPEKCGAVSPVASDIVQQALHYFPSASLIQHEWATHGTCSGLPPAQYFAAAEHARDQVKIPADFQKPTQKRTQAPSAIEADFASANPSYPAGAFRATCTQGALQEVRVCLTKDFQPRPCGETAGTCSMTGGVTVLPVQ